MSLHTTDNSSEDITGKAKAAFIWVASTSVIWQLINWALTLITARILSPDDYGVAALPGTLTPYMTLIAGMRLGTWIVQRESLTEKESGEIFTLTFFLGLASASFFLFISPFIANFYERPDLTLMFQVCSIIFFAQAVLAVPDAKLRRDLKFKALSLVELIVNISQGVITLTLAWFGYGYWALIIGILFNQITRAIAIMVIGGIPKKLGLNKSLYSEGLHYGVVAASASALWIVFSTMDDIIVGKILGTEILGFYTMAFYFSQLPMTKLHIVLMPVLMPYYSRLKNDSSELNTAYLKTSRAVFAFLAPALVGLAIVSPELIPLVIGERWLPMIPALVVLCGVSVIQSMTITVHPFFNAIGKPGRALFYNSLSVIILLPLFFFGGKNYGLAGIYYAWAIGYPIIALIIFMVLKKDTNISLQQTFLNLRAPLVALIVMASFTLSYRSIFSPESSSITLLLCTILIGVCSYTGTLWIFFKKEAKEMLLVQDEIKSAK